jgi:hypothetical protein
VNDFGHYDEPKTGGNRVGRWSRVKMTALGQKRPSAIKAAPRRTGGAECSIDFSEVVVRAFVRASLIARPPKVRFRTGRQSREPSQIASTVFRFRRARPISDHQALVCRCVLAMRQQPRKRTLLSVTRMSALCHKRTYATQQKYRLFDHFVGSRDKGLRYRESKRLERPPVDDQFKFDWNLHRQIRRFFAFDNATDIFSRSTQNVR